MNCASGLCTRRLPLLLLPFAFLSATAQVRLPHMISDHAVLQRNRPIHLWGWATPEARLVAHFHQQTAYAQADALGKWSIALAPEAAGGPYALTIAGDGPEKTVTDLLVGDVWFASGQSNMEMPLSGFPPTAFVKDASKEIAAADNPHLRLLLVDHKSSDYPLDDVSGTWTQCTPQTASRFSAIAYLFGREIAASEKVPVGLIDSTWGGTPADSWVSLDAFGRYPELLPALQSRATFAEALADRDALIAAEKREDHAATSAGKPAPKHSWHPSPESWQPAGLYNGMIAPFTPYSIKGFLWYQGETNSAPGRAPFYNTLFANLIGDWRTHFAQGDLPFLYVQISSFDSPEEDWGLVRDQQRRVLAVDNTAMVVTLDVGNPANVHPANKQTVATRLAAAARGSVYGERIEWKSPLFREAHIEWTPEGSAGMRVWFDHAHGLTSAGAPLGGFELAGPDHHFVPAQATLQGESVLVTSPALPRPAYVRYGWAGVVESYLYNSAGLPASTFSSERNPIQ